MITVTTPRVLGIARQPHDDDFDEVLAVMREYKTAHHLREVRVAFIDLVPTAEMIHFVRLLIGRSYQIDSYLDHHRQDMRRNEDDYVQELRRLLGRRFSFESRANFPSCGRLIKRREWISRKVNVVFFHNDFDGFTAYLKGCGFLYRWMLHDSDIVDSGKDRSRLSSIGKLLLNALDCVPSYGTDPVGSHAYKARVFQLFAHWLMSGLAQREMNLFNQHVQDSLRDARCTAEQLVRATTLLSGHIARCDFTSAITEKHIVVPDRWKSLVNKQFGHVLFASTVYGFVGGGARQLEKLVCVELPQAWNNKVDLTKIVAVPFVSPRSNAHRIWIALKDWDAFFAAWQLRFPHGP